MEEEKEETEVVSRGMMILLMSIMMIRYIFLIS